MSGDDYNKLRLGADIAILLSRDVTDVGGIAYMLSTGYSVLSQGKTLGLIEKEAGIEIFALGHEIGHMFGCHHNREATVPPPVNSLYPAGYGKLIPQTQSRTIMS